jgi:hypothetical protein
VVGEGGGIFRVAEVVEELAGESEVGVDRGVGLGIQPPEGVEDSVVGDGEGSASQVG